MYGTVSRLLLHNSNINTTLSSAAFVSASCLRMSSMVSSIQLSIQQNTCRWKLRNSLGYTWRGMGRGEGEREWFKIWDPLFCHTVERASVLGHIYTTPFIVIGSSKRRSGRGRPGTKAIMEPLLIRKASLFT